jgi:glutathione synthase/RimK-type ligase-like ATP-grasp enzyme
VPKPVLLLTHSGDFYTIDRVAGALRRRGAAPIRVDTDTYPMDLALSVRLSARGGEQPLIEDRGGEQPPIESRAGEQPSFEGKQPSGGEGLSLRTAEGMLDLEQVAAIWVRRLWPGRLPAAMSPRFTEHCWQQSRTAFFDSLPLLEHCRWVNAIPALLAAESKLLQLRTARRIGLSFPDTLVTNDPAAVRAFHESLGGRMVTKLLVALSQTMDGSGDFMYTSEVRAEDLDDIHGLRYAPQIFQPLIEKRRELRVIVVGRHLFAGSIDPRATQRGQIDWRLSEPGTGWAVAELPPAVEAQVRQLLRQLGLTSAAVDFIVDPAGQYHFLEVNPAGEWGWLERDLGLPIADAIAETLLEGGEP